MTQPEPRDPPTRRAIAEAIKSTLDWDVSDVTLFDEGLNAVYRVDRFDEEPVVMKTATFSSDEQLLVEAALFSRFEDETDVPVPSVYATFEPVTSLLGVAAFVMEYCEGREVTSVLDLPPWAQERVITESSRHLASLHEVRIVDEFGPLGMCDKSLVCNPCHESWNAWFEELVTETLDGLLGKGFTTDSHPRFADLEPEIREALILPSRKGYNEVDPAFLFFDYRPANLVLEQDDRADPFIRNVIDIGSGPMGDGLLDLALTENALIDIPFGGRKRATHLRDRLRAVYCETRNIEETTLTSEQYSTYRLFALTRRMSRFDYWGQFAHEEDQETTAQRWRSLARDLLRALSE